uniref:Isoform 4 of CD166 antigen n=4 Tax=Hominidae TaxID=9604 RepID=Q13740-4|nr:unnamed protein product [Homo sapiens]
MDPVTQLYTMTSTLEYKTTKADIQMPFTCSVTYYGPSGQKTIHSEQAVFDIYYLDLSLNPSGEVTRQIGDALPVSCTISASRNATVVWMKDNIRLRSSPSFSSLHYQDAGNYVCETALQEVEGLKKRESLTLIVEGKPQIKMTKKTDPSGLSKTIICHVEGFPKPAIQWTITGSGSVINQTEESPYINGRYYSKIIISPEENVTLTCTAENQLERTVNSLNVSAISIPEHDEADEISDENREKVNDQAKLIVGIVVGLLLAALVAGVVYWLYMKKSKTASKHVNKDLGNMEENKKLEENNHKTEA